MSRIVAISMGMFHVACPACIHYFWSPQTSINFLKDCFHNGRRTCCSLRVWRSRRELIYGRL